MWSQVACSTCGKPTWSGCGDHIEQALRGVPPEERCQGHATPSAGESAASQRGGPGSRPTGAG